MTEIAQATHVGWLWLIPFFPVLGAPDLGFEFGS